MTKISKENINKTMINLIYENKIFAKCPKCEKYMCLFELYNCHCNICGEIEFDKILLVSLDAD